MYKGAYKVYEMDSLDLKIKFKRAALEDLYRIIGKLSENLARSRRCMCGAVF